tara:strand:- start:95 stop:628 length:534 start_codon:yes stop_codon:yes gene_type:complete
MAAPRQMTANTLNALKGWPQMNAVDYHAEIDSSVTDTVNAGTVVSLNSSGKFVLGVGTSAVMPMFLFSNSDDPDVANDGGDASTDAGVFVPISPTGQAMALVAVGAYELVSTAYRTAGTYAPNTPLFSPDTGASEGLLDDTGTLYTEMCVGFVSRGVVDNGYGKNALAFWPFPVFPS